MDYKFVMDTITILTSSHFEHADQHKDRWTYDSVPESLQCRFCSQSHFNHTECISCNFDEEKDSTDFPIQKDGETLVLPHKVYANTEGPSQDSFRAAGLTLTVLEPFRRWRILFNGMMK